MPRTWRFILLIVAIGATFACQDTPLETKASGDDPVEEDGSPGSRTTQSEEPERPPPPGTMTATLGGGRSDQAFGPIEMGALDERTLVRVEVSGLIDLFHNYPEELAGQFAGQLDAAGQYVGWLLSCKANTRVFSSKGWNFAPCDFENREPAREVWTGRTEMDGTVSTMRGAGPTKGNLRCDGPGWPACYLLSGTMTATVTPTSDELQLEANPSTVKPGELVTFTPSTEDEEPFEIREWIWVADNALDPDAPEPRTTACAAEVEECVTAVAESGTMYVRARVGGLLQQADAHASVIPDQLQLEADKTEVWPGETVTFTSSTAEGSAYDVIEWTWSGGGDPITAPSEGGDALAQLDGTDAPQRHATPADGLEAEPRSVDDPQTQACPGTDKTCSAEVHEDGSMSVEAWVTGERQTASVPVRVMSCDSTGISVSAAGPNPGGSFLAGVFPASNARVENVVTVEAELTGDCATEEVNWEVRDDTSDVVPSPAVQTPPPGEESQFRVPLPEDRRWPGPYAQHVPNVDSTTLAYQVRAYVEPPSGRVYSPWQVVQQDHVDVIRQEYLEVVPRQNVSARLPERHEFHGVPGFTSEYGSWPIYGDHCPNGGPPCLSLSQTVLILFVGWMEVNWDLDRLRITSVYRNPVHHHEGHLKTWDEEGDSLVPLYPRNDSPHKYGTAVDFGTWNRSLRVCTLQGWQDPLECSDTRLNYWTALHNFGLLYVDTQGNYACAEPLVDSTEDHVHFDFREGNGCPDGWRDWAQYPPPDAGPHAVPPGLITQLRSPDWLVRASAADVLNRIPPNAMPPGWEEEAIAQLEHEIEISGRTVRLLDARGRHDYGEYLIDLNILAQKSGRSEAVRPLALMGIEVSRGVRQFVARHAQLAGPHLDRAWETRPWLRDDILGTYGEMLEGEKLGHVRLSEEQKNHIDRRVIEAASSEDAIARMGVAFLVGDRVMPEWTPALASLVRAPALPDDPDDVVRRIAASYLDVLENARARMPRDQLLRRVARLQQAVCADNRRQTGDACDRLGRALGLAASKIRSASREAANEHLVAARAVLTSASAVVAFTELERQLLGDNIGILLR